ncbi:SLC13 family permease [Micromonospora sp. NBC_01813]|nr:SLC13 family permease [Micromonospora sp. NBC_01813]WSA06250.1 SLC13 family permease [Micromonospora sp. NBC_01813]
MNLPHRAHPLDLVAVGLLVAGLVSVAVGLVPGGVAIDVVGRIAPLLAFLATVIVLAELTAQAEVFDVLAVGVARLGAGSYPALFVLCGGFATITTVTLNLDTTAVLLTPVMLTLARRVGIAAVPLAMTTVWLANTASLLLPVSNLTNLLAMDRLGMSTVSFAGRMWAPQLASVAVTMALLWAFFWRRGRRGVDRYVPPLRHVPVDRPLFLAAAAASLTFVVAILLAEVELWVASALCAVVLVVAFAVRRPDALRPRLLPWRLLVSVTGLFLVMEGVSRLGLSALMQALIGTDPGLVGLARATGAGLLSSNLVNNLPAYLAGESVIAYGDTDRLLALLIGTNVGAIVTPWASLATLLWFERCHAYGVRVPVTTFVVTGAGLAVVGCLATVAALAGTG